MNKDQIKLAIAPIAWTNDDMPELGQENSFEQCISEMALAGFVGSEVGRKYPRNPKILKPMLDLRGIQICNAWFSTFFVDGKKEETIEKFIHHMNFLHEMGAKVIGCSEQSKSIQGKPLPIIDAKPVFNEHEWQLLAEGYNQLNQIAQQKGMQVCLHHHMGTGIQNAAEIDYFLRIVDPNVHLLFDTGHAYYAEGSQEGMMNILKKHIQRINHVHLKDVRKNIIEKVILDKLSFLEGVKLGTFTVPGDGDIDFKPVFELLEQYQYHGWMVVEAEQDPALANPFEYALKARQFIQQSTGL